MKILRKLFSKEKEGNRELKKDIAVSSGLLAGSGASALIGSKIIPKRIDRDLKWRLNNIDGSENFGVDIYTLPGETQRDAFNRWRKEEIDLALKKKKISKKAGLIGAGVLAGAGLGYAAYKHHKNKKSKEK